MRRRLAQLAPFIRSCFIGRISYLAPTSSRIIGSAADYLRRRYATRTPPAHIWMGVSVEDEKSKVRIGHLQAAPAGVRFLSIEPLLGPMGRLDLTGIHWVLLGGESGPRARPMDIEWVRGVRDQCIESAVAFNFKRWGGLRPKARGRLLDGREWNEFPTTCVGTCEGGVTDRRLKPCRGRNRTPSEFGFPGTA
jgi:protein gp37